MQFSAGPGSSSAHIIVDFRLLRELLRLPKHVEIVAVRADPNNSHKCIVDLAGLLPAEGELEAEYKYMHTTIVTFDGFRIPQRD